MNTGSDSLTVSYVVARRADPAWKDDGVTILAGIPTSTRTPALGIHITVIHISRPIAP